MEGQEGKFMKNKYWGSGEFRAAADKQADRTAIRTGETVPNDPEDKIENYLSRFTDVLERTDREERERGVESLKRLLHRKYLTKPDSISDEYIKGVLFGNYAEQKGYSRADLRDPDIKKSLLEQFQGETGQTFGEYSIPKEQREQVIESAVKDQEQRLDFWFAYLTSDEAKNYPVAYRYWAFAEMLKLGSYDDERQTYNKRTDDTAAPFPELDQQALAIVLDEVGRSQNKESSNLLIDDEGKQIEFKKRLQSENFGKLYAFTQEHLKTLRLPEERLIITAGEWKSFPKGSDPQGVVEILQGFHTQWCIAGYGTAQSYLSHSDLYIYLSEDEKGINSIPRACIVNSGKRGITEVRGIVSDGVSKQHLDDYITPKVSEKLQTIPSGEKWQKQMSDMKQLAKIHIKHRQRETLDTTDLKFLYQIEDKIQTTGYNTDPRISEILEGRDVKSDLPIIFDCRPDQISNIAAGVNENTVAYFGPWNPTTYEKIRQYPNIKHIYEKFPSQKAFFKEIVPDPEITSAETAVAKLEKEGHTLSGYVKEDMLPEVNWQEKLKSSYEVVSFSVADLFGDQNVHTYAEIKAKAAELGLGLVSQALAPSIRLNYDKNGEWTRIAMEAIRGRDGNPKLFLCDRDGDESWLDSNYGHDDYKWYPDHRFFFVRK